MSRGGRCATPLDRRRHLNVRALHHKGSGRPLLYDSHLVLRTTRRYAVTASKSGDKEQGCCPPVFKRTKIRGAGPPVDKARSAAIATVPNGTSYVWPSDSLGLRDVLARSDSASGDLRPERLPYHKGPEPSRFGPSTVTRLQTPRRLLAVRLFFSLIRSVSIALSHEKRADPYYR